MRSLLRVGVPLLLGLAVLAWMATIAVAETTRSWFTRDVELRARLAASGAQEGLASHLAAGEQRKVLKILEGLAQDERIMAAEVCTAAFLTVARTQRIPASFGCEGLEARRHGAGARDLPGELDAELDGGPVHLSVHAIRADGELRGYLVLFQDMSVAARRETAAKHFTIAVFAVVAVLASILTALVRRDSWRTWTQEFRRVLALAPRSPGLPSNGPAAFSPVLQDVRQLVEDLAKERASASGGRWSPERLQQTLRDALHGESVVILGNREPYVHERGADGAVRVLHPASGLVTALEPVMRACSGTWIAHGSGSADRDTVDACDRVRVPPGEESYAIRRVWLSKEEERGYYYGFSNEGLWALCHIAHARPEFRASDWQQYVTVNERFAKAVCDEVKGPDPVILVQDYHFALVPRMIRERLPRATIITFWHIPWPNAERLGICPWRREVLDGLLGSSVVGFHTQQHCNNFVEAVDRYLETRIDRERQSVVQGGRECLVRNYPISIEWPNRWAAAAPPAAECRHAVLAELGLDADALLGVGVDRLDYTKGIEERLLAVERALERFPHLRGRFTFAQLAAPSRTLIPRYAALNDAVEALAARINRRFASGTYRPIVLLRAHHEPPAIFRYLRAADVCYVSSLHDGMNLVAKEFVAARDDERGVLVLSQFTGAARELTEALVVNPYDLEEASAALATALQMPAAEQAERMRAMRAMVSELNVYRWAGRMLADAGRLRQRGRLSDRLSLGLRVVGGGRS
ncbi:alpha,alpha-trehalose-phosphate synthase (UDP-forming) [Anaeromyxobacter oryzae]|uniref:Trehalose-6-phosphate synthase n=1 Tax=Anaeromyxobacter oryzae TaxID=2918170 RepID=A0ABN6MPL0_9BACT|nr:trehalose-6-phosphate synthase [Anaeromyxobacter oryzae]BDG02311.1 trehalose-6-phosphate synthase [Anaeromyxobacter oryzae]